MKVSVGDFLKYTNTLNEYTIWEVLKIDDDWFTGIIIKCHSEDQEGVMGGPFPVEPASDEQLVKVNQYKTKLGKVLYR